MSEALVPPCAALAGLAPACFMSSFFMAFFLSSLIHVKVSAREGCCK